MDDLAPGEADEGRVTSVRVCFVDLTRRPLVASTFGTHTVRFVDLTNPMVVTSTKCILGHPYRALARPIPPLNAAVLTKAAHNRNT